MRLFTPELLSSGAETDEDRKGLFQEEVEVWSARAILESGRESGIVLASK